jgi:hypothetical protein
MRTNRAQGEEPAAVRVPFEDVAWPTCEALVGREPTPDKVEQWAVSYQSATLASPRRPLN